jgi:hypothetical protein
MGKDMLGLPADSLKKDPYSFDSQFASLYYIKQHYSKCQGETSARPWWNTNVHAPTSNAGSGAWPTSLLGARPLGWSFPFLSFVSQTFRKGLSFVFQTFRKGLGAS